MPSSPDAIINKEAELAKAREKLEETRMMGLTLAVEMNMGKDKILALNKHTEVEIDAEIAKKTSTPKSPEPAPKLDEEEPAPAVEPKEDEDAIWSSEKMKVYETRQIYTKEYLKCRKEMSRKVLIERTRVTAQNLVTGVKNVFMKEGHKIDKKHFNEEQYFTGEYIESKKAYDQARVEMGNALYHEKYAELKEQGLSGQELQDALTNYKSTEILQKTIIDERQKLLDAKAEGSPVNQAKWKKAIAWYSKLPRWQKLALSTTIFAGVAAVSAGAVTGSVIGAAGYRLAKGMITGTLVGHTSKLLDLAYKGKNKKFEANKESTLKEMREKFGEGSISQEEYEKSLAWIENEDKKNKRKQILVKAAVGIAIGASASGFMAHEFGGASVSENTVENNIKPDTAVNQIPAGDAQQVKIDTVANVQQPPVPAIEQTPDVDQQAPAVTEQVATLHSAVEISVGKGHGAIETINELKDKLNAEYPNPSEAPASVQHILNTKADALAMEYGMFKPGEVEESALFKVGGKFDVDGNGNVSYHESATSSETLLAKGADIKATGAYEGKMIDSDRPSQPRVSTEDAQRIPTEECQQEKPEGLKQIDESGLKKISGDTIEKPEVKDIDMRGLKKISGNDIGESVPKGPEDVIDQGANKNTLDSLPKSELPEIKSSATPEILPRTTPNILEGKNNGFTNKVTMTGAPNAKVPAETFGNNNGNIEPTRGIFNDGTRRNITEDLTLQDAKGLANMTRLENDVRNLDTERDIREAFGRSNIVVSKPESAIVENNIDYREWNAATNNMLAEKEVTLNNYADYEKERELQQLFGHAEHGVRYDEALDKNMEGTQMYYYKELPEWKTVEKIPARYFFDMENAKPSIPDAQWNKLVEAGVVRQSVDTMGNTHYAFAHERELKRLSTVYNTVDPLNATPLGDESMEKYITRITRDLHQTKDGTLYMFKDTKNGVALEKGLDDGSIVKQERGSARSMQNNSTPVNTRLGNYPTSSELNPNGPFAERVGGIFSGNMFGNNSFTTPVKMTR